MTDGTAFRTRPNAIGTPPSRGRRPDVTRAGSVSRSEPKHLVDARANRVYQHIREAHRRRSRACARDAPPRPCPDRASCAGPGRRGGKAPNLASTTSRCSELRDPRPAATTSRSDRSPSWANRRPARSSATAPPWRAAGGSIRPRLKCQGSPAIGRKAASAFAPAPRSWRQFGGRRRAEYYRRAFCASTIFGVCGRSNPRSRHATTPSPLQRPAVCSARSRPPRIPGPASRLSKRRDARGASAPRAPSSPC
mmetsp:Transcript_32582/g.89902  ORF Transcript_32582/g.89902 Transcript_32582/m.89902 type:complete len:251 (-) Transcript_32582:828-1580(-)